MDKVIDTTHVLVSDVKPKVNAVMQIITVPFVRNDFAKFNLTNGAVEYSIIQKAEYGYENSASANGAIAFGINSKAAGSRAFAHGNNAQANGNSAFAHGVNVTAGGEGAFVSGKGNASGAAYSFVTGVGNNADVDAFGAFVSGDTNHAQHKHVNLLGYNLQDTRDYQTIVGVSNFSSDALFIVAKGGDAVDSRSNAFEVFDDGRAKLYGTPIDDVDVVRKIDLQNAIDDLLNFEDSDGIIESFKEVENILGKDAVGLTNIISKISNNTLEIQKVDNKLPTLVRLI